MPSQKLEECTYRNTWTRAFRQALFRDLEEEGRLYKTLIATVYDVLMLHLYPLLGRLCLVEPSDSEADTNAHQGSVSNARAPETRIKTRLLCEQATRSGYVDTGKGEEETSLRVLLKVVRERPFVEEAP